MNASQSASPRAPGPVGEQPLGPLASALDQELGHRLVALGTGALEATWRLYATVEAAGAGPAKKPQGEQTFLEFSNQWWKLYENEWTPRTKKDYKWALELHVLP